MTRDEALRKVATRERPVVHALDKGCTATRGVYVNDYAYPKSGNAHNPTPHYHYVVLDAEGNRLGVVRSLKAAKDLVSFDERLIKAGE